MYKSHRDGERIVCLRGLPRGTSEIPSDPHFNIIGSQPQWEDHIRIIHSRAKRFEEWDILFVFNDRLDRITITNHGVHGDKWRMRRGNGYDPEHEKFSTMKLYIDPLYERWQIIGETLYDYIVKGIEAGDMTKVQLLDYVRTMMKAESEIERECKLPI